MNTSTTNTDDTAARSRERGGARSLRAHGVWVRPTSDSHAELSSLLKGIAASRPGFVDLPALPTVGPAASIILEDDDGKLYELDTRGSEPVLRPWTRPAPATGSPGSEDSSHHAATTANQPQPTLRSGGSSSSPASQDFMDQVLAGAGQRLASQFMTSLFTGGAIGPALFAAMNPGNLISGLGGAALQNLGNMLMGSLMGSLFGGVTDESSAGSQLAAKFAPQLLGQVQSKAMELANQAISGGSVGDGMMKEIEQFFFGVESKASIPIGLSVAPVCAADYVLSPKAKDGPHHAALRELDLAVHEKCGVPSPFVKGHPTVLINGKPAIGKGHTAVCAKCGEPLMPLDLSPTVLMGKPPPPPPPPKNEPAKNDANKQIGDECTPEAEGQSEPNAKKSQAESEALSESEEGGLGRPLSCEPNMSKADPNAPGGGVVSRADGVPEWFKNLPGVENLAAPEQLAAGIDNWSILWGAIEIGSPQQPGAGTGGSWWIPDKVFGYDMSPYFLRHDQVFNDDRNLSQLAAILRAEADAFTAGLAGRPDLGLLILQMIYSGSTTTAGLSAGASNTAHGRPPVKP